MPNLLDVYCDDGAWTVTHPYAPGISAMGIDELDALRTFSEGILEWIESGRCFSENP